MSVKTLQWWNVSPASINFQIPQPPNIYRGLSLLEIADSVSPKKIKVPPPSPSSPALSSPGSNRVMARKSLGPSVPTPVKPQGVPAHRNSTSVSPSLQHQASASSVLAPLSAASPSDPNAAALSSWTPSVAGRVPPPRRPNPNRRVCNSVQISAAVEFDRSTGNAILSKENKDALDLATKQPTNSSEPQIEKPNIGVGRVRPIRKPIATRKSGTGPSSLVQSSMPSTTAIKEGDEAPTAISPPDVPSLSPPLPVLPSIPVVPRPAPPVSRVPFSSLVPPSDKDKKSPKSSEPTEMDSTAIVSEESPLSSPKRGPPPPRKNAERRTPRELSRSNSSQSRLTQLDDLLQKVQQANPGLSECQDWKDVLSLLSEIQAQQLQQSS